MHIGQMVQKHYCVELVEDGFIAWPGKMWPRSL